VDNSQVKAGELLFNHEWEVNDPLCPDGDGLGPVFNARSCVACHHQGGPGGAGGLEHNVTTFAMSDRRGFLPQDGVLHTFATEVRFQETLKVLDPALADFRPLNFELVKEFMGRSSVQLSQRNTPALFGAGLIDLISEQAIVANERQQRLSYGMAPADTDNLPVGRAHRLPDGRIGKFGWKAQTASLAEFVEAACANELGLGNPTNAQPKSLAQRDYRPPGLDLSQSQCDELTSFVAALPRPTERPPSGTLPRGVVDDGKAIFTKIGCAECHTPNLGSVQGVYSDLLLHRMGDELIGKGSSYGGRQIDTSPGSPGTSGGPGPLADEWRTPPLWGVADSAPYLHDGRAATLEQAITMHGGQGAAASRRFQGLNDLGRYQLIAFLNTLRAP
jgi:CxxC motif-containing protein (DUF1111 family)